MAVIDRQGKDAAAMPHLKTQMGEVWQIVDEMWFWLSGSRGEELPVVSWQINKPH